MHIGFYMNRQMQKFSFASRYAISGEQEYRKGETEDLTPKRKKYGHYWW